MNWNQIESKWAAMTRRVQADWKPRKAPAPEKGDGPPRAIVPKDGPVADIRKAVRPAVHGLPPTE